MTLYLIGGAVFFIVMVYFYAKNQGFKDAALDYYNKYIKDKSIKERIKHSIKIKKNK